MKCACALLPKVLGSFREHCLLAKCFLTGLALGDVFIVGILNVVLLWGGGCYMTILYPFSVDIYMCNALYLYCPVSKLLVNNFFSSCLITRVPKAEIASDSNIYSEQKAISLLSAKWLSHHSLFTFRDHNGIYIVKWKKSHCYSKCYSAKRNYTWITESVTYNALVNFWCLLWHIKQSYLCHALQTPLK